jgi:ribosomal protein S18 acetylase RimI-like enzyme
VSSVAEVRILDGITPDRVEAAAQLWADATAARDGADHFQSLAWTRPVIAAAIAEVTDSAMLTAVAADDHPIGFAVIQSSGPGVAIVRYFAVRSAVWGHGVGRRLLSELTYFLSARGFAGAELWVRNNNDAAIGLYERLGWGWDGASRPNPDSGHLMLHYTLDVGPDQ